MIVAGAPVQTRHARSADGAAVVGLACELAQPFAFCRAKADLSYRGLARPDGAGLRGRSADDQRRGLAGDSTFHLGDQLRRAAH